MNDLHRARVLLEEGMNALNLVWPDEKCTRLIEFLSLLIKWNKVYNLTAVRDPLSMVNLHLLDCLAVVPVFSVSHRILDIGSGAGLPGIILAISYPKKDIHLIDIVHKKTAFLNQVKAELGLSNVTIHTGRVEMLHVEQFDTLTARAVADSATLIERTAHLLAPNGRILAMKGQLDHQEQILPSDWAIAERLPIHVPNVSAQRHLFDIRRIYHE